jgi:hypothetical protein
MKNLRQMPYWDLLDEAKFLASRYPIDSIDVAINRLSKLLNDNYYELDLIQITSSINEARISRRPI